MCGIVEGETYGYQADIWEKAKSEAIRTIVHKGSTISYSELAANIRSIAFDPHDHGFHYLLGQISVEEDAAGRGMLSALVVHKLDGMPGEGFWDLAQTLGRDIKDRVRCWSRETELVLSHFPCHPRA
jgi:hypothetical protein